VKLYRYTGNYSQMAEVYDKMNCLVNVISHCEMGQVYYLYSILMVLYILYNFYLCMLHDISDVDTRCNLEKQSTE